VRFKVNLNHYQADVVEALARLNRKQTATLLAEIIESYIDQFDLSPQEATTHVKKIQKRA
jgi:uncharacterized membrane protein affecting hemolysin expression